LVAKTPSTAELCPGVAHVTDEATRHSATEDLRDSEERYRTLVDTAREIIEATPRPIHVVLTDMVMPRMSGQELATRIVALKPTARIVFTSGYSDQVIGAEGTLEPGTLFLQKPFTMDALMRMIRRALDANTGGSRP
jgi:FixJ family two-component response regulator